MRPFALALPALCAALALAACSSSLPDPDTDSDTAVADVTAPLDAFGKTITGSYRYLPLEGSYEELRTLTLAASGTYTATKPTGGTEKGTFSTSGTTAHKLTLRPAGASARVYAIEAADDHATLSLTRKNRTEMLSLDTGTAPSCQRDADCAKGQTCKFAETGSTCVDAGTPKPPPVDAGTAPASCKTRKGGAFITFRAADEPLTVWSTDGAFIDESKVLLASGDHRTPNFGLVIDGTDCDARYSWHVKADDMGFADFTTEVCDGTPSYLEAHKATWIRDVKRYCPWGPTVTAVDDRR